MFAIRLGAQLWLQLWLYVAKYGELFKHLERILCARKICVSYWFFCELRPSEWMSVT